MNFLWTIYPLELVHLILQPPNKHKWKCTIYASQIFTFVISFQNLWQEYKYLFRFANGVARHHLSSASCEHTGIVLNCQKFSDNTSHTHHLSHLVKTSQNLLFPKMPKFYTYIDLHSKNSMAQPTFQSNSIGKRYEFLKKKSQLIPIWNLKLIKMFFFLSYHRDKSVQIFFFFNFKFIVQSLDLFAH